jgi:putative endonuclease
MERSLNNKRTAGTVGEKMAEEYLIENNYAIITKNFRYKRLGEIDIIARDNGFVCFIEVKTRSTLEYGLPIEAVSFRKQENIRKLASIFICKNNLHNANIRFDVVEVYVRKEKDFMNVEKINLIKNAF